MEGTPVNFTTTNRGKPKAACEGYYYTLAKRSKTDVNLSFWQCEERRSGFCQARIHVRNGFKVQQTHHHNHGPYPARFHALEAVNQMKVEARETQNPTVNIVMQHTNGIPEAAGVALPQESALKRRIQKTRCRHQQIPIAPTSRAEIVLPDEYRLHNVELFLLDDSGNDENRLLIFGGGREGTKPELLFLKRLLSLA